MRYELFGAFELPRDDRHIYLDRDAQNEFWEYLEEEYPGLKGACGCYVFATKSGRGGKPWYIGKAEKLSFQRECFTADKIVKYNSALRLVKKGTPVIYLCARITPGRRRFCKPSGNGARDVDYLEKMLITLALERNSHLINIRETKLLKNMVVPGLLNTPRGKLPESAAELCRILGI